ncbi:MAG: DMT family transporter [Pseudomonadota bacterium]|nr:DMT family transporter [Pseudomonadota bacterium]
MQSLWMLAAGLCFAVMGVFVKLGAPQFKVAELVLYRSLVMMLLGWIVLARSGASLRTARLGTHMHRSVSGFVSLFMFFYALSVLPVATAITLNYTSPIFLAALIALLARERPGTRLSATVVLGFAGVLLLLRPSFHAEELWAGGMGLASGALSAIAYWNVRSLVQADEPVGRVVFYFGLISCFGALVWMAPQTWTPLTRSNVVVLAGLGVSGALGQLAMTRAYGNGPALVAAALSYSSIVFSSLLGLAVLGDVLPLLSWIGIALIVAAGIIAVQLAPPTPRAPPPQISSE